MAPEPADPPMLLTLGSFSEWSPPTLQLASVRDRSSCTCCLPNLAVINRIGEEPPALQPICVFADPLEAGQAACNGHDAEAVLGHLFGNEAGLHGLFGSSECAAARPARWVAEGGLNHVFMAERCGRLVKCVQPKGPHQSEAHEAERLRASLPLLGKDVHAVFPLNTFTCQAVPPTPPRPASEEEPCELLVFSFFENSRSLGEVVRKFERTHAVGVLQSTAACFEFRQTGTCEHCEALRSLVVEQVPLLGQRFQVLHGRRHGDLKADNVLIEQTGNLRLLDFLSPFCRNCDQDEFLSSTLSTHPLVQELRTAFTTAWQANMAHSNKASCTWLEPDNGAECCALVAEDISRNAQLVEALDLMEARRQSDNSGHSLFGPPPSLLENISEGLMTTKFSTMLENLNVLAPAPQWPNPTLASFAFPEAQDRTSPSPVMLMPPCPPSFHLPVVVPQAPTSSSPLDAGLTFPILAFPDASFQGSSLQAPTSSSPSDAGLTFPTLAFPQVQDRTSPTVQMPMPTCHSWGALPQGPTRSSSSSDVGLAPPLLRVPSTSSPMDICLSRSTSYDFSTGPVAQFQADMGMFNLPSFPQEAPLERGCPLPVSQPQGQLASFEVSGTLGMSTDDAGYVNRLVEGRASMLGVQVGWQVHSIDHQPFCAPLLTQRVAEALPFQITFLIKGVNTTSGSASSTLPEQLPPQSSSSQVGDTATGNFMGMMPPQLLLPLPGMLFDFGAGAGFMNHAAQQSPNRALAFPPTPQLSLVPPLLQGSFTSPIQGQHRSPTPNAGMGNLGGLMGMGGVGTPDGTMVIDRGLPFFPHLSNASFGSSTPMGLQNPCSTPPSCAAQSSSAGLNSFSFDRSCPSNSVPNLNSWANGLQGFTPPGMTSMLLPRPVPALD